MTLSGLTQWALTPQPWQSERRASSSKWSSRIASSTLIHTQATSSSNRAYRTHRLGMVGTIDERTQEHLVKLLLALTSQDADRLVEAFMELGVTSQQVDRSL